MSTVTEQEFNEMLAAAEVVAWRVAGTLTWVDQDAVMSAARYGLVLAAQRFDPSRQVKFLSYAWRYMEGYARKSIRDQVRAKGITRRRWEAKCLTDEERAFLTPVSLHTKVGYHQRETLEELQPDPNAEFAAAIEQRELLQSAIRTLNPRLQEVIRLRYYEDLPQRDVADRLGLSQMHISRLEQIALRRLRGVVAP